MVKASVPTKRYFTLTGGYQFADTYPVDNQEPFIHAEAGRLTGSFHWEFEDGTSGNTHVNGATANRMVPEGNSLFGTMRINMFELEGLPRDEHLLFLQKEHSSMIRSEPRPRRTERKWWSAAKRLCLLLKKPGCTRTGSLPTD